MKTFLFGIFLFTACLVLAAGDSDTQQFKDYWYKGKAELTRYDLKQARYGQIHKGEAVLIFVTEPFLTDKQVKYEEGDKSKAVPVLKLNFTRKFYTGIYPYSIMTSTFSPVDYLKMRTLKITSSSQEWCGNTFMQLNFKNNQYDGQIRSYFQAEGDQNITVKAAWLEDELWTRVRLAPSTLPKGEFEVAPGLTFIRLWHQPLKAEKAVGTLTDAGKFNVYTVDYKSIRRKLVIQFAKTFPYTISEWEETQPGGFGDSPLLTTKAVKTNSILLDYWSHHNLEDAHYRQELGLTQ